MITQVHACPTSSNDAERAEFQNVANVYENWRTKGSLAPARPAIRSALLRMRAAVARAHSKVGRTEKI